MPPSRWMAPAITLLLFTAACKDHPAAPVVKDKTLAHTLNAPELSVTGTWYGMFRSNEIVKTVDKETGDSILLFPNKITLFIDQMQDGKIFGYTVCAGDDRPFTGVYTQEGDKIKATLREPGDNKNDGVFDLLISNNPLLITGKWTPLNPTQVGRHYVLTRKNFVYDSTAGQYPEGSMKLLATEDINNLLKDELRAMRNEIYARHGYAFKRREMRQLFDNQDWYMPISTDVRKKLTAIEINNEKVIRQFEKYAEDSYEDFGR